MDCNKTITVVCRNDFSQDAGLVCELHLLRVQTQLATGDVIPVVRYFSRTRLMTSIVTAIQIKKILVNMSKTEVRYFVKYMYIVHISGCLSSCLRE